MDRADMRRGRATVHVRFDERRAILSGDTMLTLAIASGRRVPSALLPDALALSRHRNPGLRRTAI